MTTRPTLGERLGLAPQTPPATIAARDPERARRLTQGLRLDSNPLQDRSPAPISPVPTDAMPEPTPPRKPRSGYRRNAVFHVHGNFDWRILDRNQRAKLWSVAQSMERITKQKGQRNGCLGAIGLSVLNCLLFRFLNAGSGRCDPSYDTLQKLTGHCRQSISTAIDRLESSGLVTVTRRMVRLKERIVCALTGRTHEIVVVRQISNAYVLSDPACVAIPNRQADRPVRMFPARQAPSVFAAVLAGVYDKFRGVEFRGVGRLKPSLSDREKLKQPVIHPLAGRYEVRTI
jgi:hypothetical protein